MLGLQFRSSIRTYGLIGLLIVVVLLRSARAFAQDSSGDGVVSPQATEIVGGQPASPGEWPWQVLLKKDGVFACGGSLVHPRWVLTAAHCLVDNNGDFGPVGSYLPVSAVTVVLGEHDRASVDGGEQLRNVVQIVVHPGYRGATLNDNDIALLKLDLPATLDTRVGIVPLLNSPLDDTLTQPGVLATSTGWGRTISGDPSSNSDILLEIEIPIVANAICQTAYAPGQPITDNMICAGYEEGGKSACQGDSGGPLVVPAGAGSWKQTGLVSFGPPTCASPGKPAVYTRISRYVSWIQQYIASPNGPAPVRNGDFESGSNGEWYEGSSAAPGTTLIIKDDLPVSPHSGSYVAFLGGRHSDTSYLLQNVPLSDRATTLSFYYQIGSFEDDCLSDLFRIIINGAEVASIPLCSPNNTSAWQLGTVDLTSFAGQTIELVLVVVTDSALFSSLLIDDVSIANTAPPPLAVTGFMPTSGRRDSSVSLTGSDFLDVSEVLFDGVAAQFTVLSDGSLNTIVPSGAGTGPITVKTAYATTTSAAAFTVLHPLTVAKAGSGDGSVTSASVGISCGADCTQDYADDTAVALTAQPAADSTFTGWTGACSGNQPLCNVTVNATKTATATFALKTFTLETFVLTVAKAGDGSGTVTSSPAGVNCGAACSSGYTTGTQVTLTAQPAANSLFTSWSGACSGTGATCQVTVDAAKTATATFTLKTFTLKTFAVTVVKEGTGNGTITSAVAGINCGADCSETYIVDTQITLTAQPAADALFVEWTGACSGSDVTCQLTVDAAKNVTARFALKTFVLSVELQGSGGGTVTSDPAGIACGADCGETYIIGTSVALTAAPSDNSLFGGWGGVCSDDQLVCAVTIDAATSITATFERREKEGLLLPAVIR